MGDVTNCNSSMVIYIYGLGRENVVGFAKDQMWDTGVETITNIEMGVDGRSSISVAPSLVTIDVSLAADSPSAKWLSGAAARIQSFKRHLPVEITISAPSLGEIYSYTDGGLISGKTVPSSKKELESITFSFAFAKVTRQTI